MTASQIRHSLPQPGHARVRSVLIGTAEEGAFTMRRSSVRPMRLIVTAAAAYGLFAAGASAQEAFKSSKFLTYSAESQKSYISTAIMMAGSIAAQNKREQARCIDDWAAKHDATGFIPVTEAMKRFPDYHPAGVILAVLQKACGSFKYHGS